MTTPRGRQVEAARNDRLLLDAARDVFGSRGFDAPVSAVAARAGVGIGSLYRRYATKDDLLRRLCTLAMEQGISAARAGLRADDPWEGFAGYVRKSVEFGGGALAPLAGTLDTTPEMWATARRARALTGRLVARARRAGALRADVTALDVALLIERLGRRPAGPPTGDEDTVRARLVAVALAGLRADRRPGSEPLPGRPPSAVRYEGRWRRPPG